MDARFERAFVLVDGHVSGYSIQTSEITAAEACAAKNAFLNN
jgi:hypothetical protein